MVKFLPLQMILQWNLSALLWLPWRGVVIVPFVDDTAQNVFAAVLLYMVQDRLFIGGGGSCGDRVNSRVSTWPMCMSCLHCTSCCSC